jgi:hypothetical protein
MFDTGGESNYDAILRDLLAVSHRTGAATNAPHLGGDEENGTARIPLFGRPCRVEPEGVWRNGSRLDTTGSILVLRYLLQGGDAPIQNTWLSYRDLKDGALFSSFIRTHVEDRIAARFSEKAPALKGLLRSLGSSPVHGAVAADIVEVLTPLPRIPVLSIFRDRDEEFPAAFQFFFDASASSYLDLECLAALLHYICLNLTEET